MIHVLPVCLSHAQATGPRSQSFRSIRCDPYKVLSAINIREMRYKVMWSIITSNRHQNVDECERRRKRRRVKKNSLNMPTNFVYMIWHFGAEPINEKNELNGFDKLWFHIAFDLLRRRSFYLLICAPYSSSRSLFQIFHLPPITRSCFRIWDFWFTRTLTRRNY